MQERSKNKDGETLLDFSHFFSRMCCRQVYYLFQISWFEQRQEGYLIHKRNTSGCSCPKYFRKGLSLQLRARHGTLLEKSVCVGLVQIISVAVDLVIFRFGMRTIVLGPVACVFHFRGVIPVAVIASDFSTAVYSVTLR